MEHLVTDCCGENILYEKEADGSLSMCEFCKNCLEPCTQITEQEFLEKFCSHCLNGVSELVPATNKEHGTCDDCTKIVVEHLKDTKVFCKESCGCCESEFKGHCPECEEDDLEQIEGGISEKTMVCNACCHQFQIEAKRWEIL